MTTTTTYGTWNNHGDRYSVTVGDTILNSLGNADCEWVDRLVSTGALDRIEADYRDAIADVLPAGVFLSGSEFIGPAYAEDQHWDGDLDLSELIATVDLWPLVEKHDPDLATTDA